MTRDSWQPSGEQGPGRAAHLEPEPLSLRSESSPPPAAFAIATMMLSARNWQTLLPQSASAFKFCPFQVLFKFSQTQGNIYKLMPARSSARSKIRVMIFQVLRTEARATVVRVTPGCAMTTSGFLVPYEIVYDLLIFIICIRYLIRYRIHRISYRILWTSWMLYRIWYHATHLICDILYYIVHIPYDIRVV